MVSVSYKRSGLPFALAAYFLWGVMPAFITLLNGVDPYRLVAWRVLWTLPVCLVFLLIWGGFASIRAAFRDRRTLWWLLLAALLISANWIIYVVAVQAGYFYAASLGYYINPLVNVLLGTLFLKERLSRLQWLAVAIAAVGIAILAFEARATLFVSLGLALSFGTYGLIRKQVSVEAVPGLSVEVLLLTIPSLIALAILPAGPRAFGDDWNVSLLLVCSGLMTGAPLVLFATAARRMTYSALGFVQFMAPTMVFLQGLLIYGEKLMLAQGICFALIWTAIVLFCGDILMKSRRGNPVIASEPA